MSYAEDEGIWGLRRIEVEAREIIDHGLGQGRSRIDPETLAWGEEPVADLRYRIVDNANMGEGTFLEKLQEQLGGAPRPTVLLAAELLALQELPLGNLSGHTKLERVRTVLGWLDAPVEMPDDTREALDGPGTFNGGMAFNVQLWQQLGWLLDFLVHWWEQDDDRRARALHDPWAFHEIVDEPASGQVAIRNSLLYLAFPRTFMPIVSQDHKVAIRNAFASVIGGPSGDGPTAIDRDLLEIHRRQCERATVEVIHYYREPYHSQWAKNKPRGDGSPRAWLVRSRLGGADLVGRWRETGFVSLAGTHLGEIAPGANRRAISDAVEQGYQHLDYPQRLRLATEYHQFL
ncbi:MAG: hypothetical protein ACRDRL_02570, partial [Sciscionella sp.]